MDKKRYFVTLIMHTILCGQTKTFIMKNLNLTESYLRLRENALLPALKRTKTIYKYY